MKNINDYRINDINSEIDRIQLEIKNRLQAQGKSELYISNYLNTRISIRIFRTKYTPEYLNDSLEENKQKMIDAHPTLKKLLDGIDKKLFIGGPNNEVEPVKRAYQILDLVKDEKLTNEAFTRLVDETYISHSEFISEIYGFIDDAHKLFETEYTYLTAKDSYIVGIYKNTGETIVNDDAFFEKHKDEFKEEFYRNDSDYTYYVGDYKEFFPQNTNMLGVGYVPSSNVDDSLETLETVANIIAFDRLDTLVGSYYGGQIETLTDSLRETIKGAIETEVSGFIVSNGFKMSDEFVSQFNDQTNTYMKTLEKAVSGIDREGLSAQQKKDIKTLDTIMNLGTWALGIGGWYGILAGGAIALAKEVNERYLSKIEGEKSLLYFIKKNAPQSGSELFGINTPLIVKEEYYLKAPTNEEINYSIEEGGLTSIVADSTVKNTVIGDNNSNYIRVVGGDDNKLSGGDGADTLIGFDNRDTIEGGYGNDYIWGGKGEDTLAGNEGHDTYIYMQGDGKKTIVDLAYENEIDRHGNPSVSRNNTLILNNIDQKNVYIEAPSTSKDILIKFKDNPDDEILLKDAQEMSDIEDSVQDKTITILQFGINGTPIDFDDFVKIAMSENLQGTNQKNFLFGNGFDADVEGFGGDDTLVGGKGIDTLKGGADSDTYIFNKNDGKDTIYEKISDLGTDTIIINGYTTQELNVSKVGNDAVISFVGNQDDLITIKDYYSDNGVSIESVEVGGVTYDTSEGLNAVKIETNPLVLGKTDFDNQRKTYNVHDYQGVRLDGIDKNELFHYRVIDSNGTVTNDLMLVVDQQNTIKKIKLENFYSQSGFGGIKIGNSVFTKENMFSNYIQVVGVSNKFDVNILDELANVISYDRVDNFTDIFRGELKNLLDFDDSTQLVENSGLLKAYNAPVVRFDLDPSNMYIAASGLQPIFKDKRLSDKILMRDHSLESIDFARAGNSLIIKAKEFGVWKNKLNIVDYFTNSNNKIEYIEMPASANFSGGTYKVNELVEWSIQYNRALNVIPKPVDVFNDTSMYIIGENGEKNHLNYSEVQMIINGERKNLFYNAYNKDGQVMVSLYEFSRLMSSDTQISWDNAEKRATINVDGQTHWVDYNDSKTSITATDYSVNGTEKRMLVAPDIICTNDDNDYTLMVDVNVLAEIYGLDLEWNSSNNSIVVEEQGILTPVENSKDVYGSNLDDFILGGSASDRLEGRSGDDSIYGGSGNDLIFGNDGSDVIHGGKGNDILYGGKGNDVYHFGIGDGNDKIFEIGTAQREVDKIIFGPGITQENIVFERNVNDLVIKVKNHQDTLTVKGYFSPDTSYYKCIEAMEFSDGIVWNESEVGSLEISASQLNDTLYGTNENDNFVGSDENDTVLGDSGQDYLNGGAGNDLLIGGSGDDTYIFEIGSGHDVIMDYNTSFTNGIDSIKMGQGILRDQLKLSRWNGDLIINIDGSDDQLTIKDYLSKKNGIERILFSDGTIWDEAELAKQPILDLNQNNPQYDNSVTKNTYGGSGNDLLYGSEKNDYLNGNGGDDVLDGRAGNDQLNGGLGSDTYVFGVGSGNDIIKEYDYDEADVNRVKLASNVTKENILLLRDGTDLIIGIEGEVDSLNVDGYFYGDNSKKLNYIEFASGDKWYYSEVNEAVKNISEVYKHIQDTYNLDIDEISRPIDILGSSENDVFVGSKRNEKFIGDTGDDVYSFEIGSGQDVIEERPNNNSLDKVKFGAGITLENLKLSREEGSLILSIEGESDSLRIDEFYRDSEQASIEVFEFSDGTVLSQNEMMNMPTNGSSENDVLEAYEESSHYFGGSGDDKLYGDKNDNILDGGRGNDRLYGEGGNDTYVFGIGYGHDIIENDNGYSKTVSVVKLNEGILPEELIFTRNHDDLTISLKNYIDQLTISKFYSSSKSIDKLVFENGLVWNSDVIRELPLTGSETSENLYGTHLSDKLFGLSGDDNIYAGNGDDIINGGTGNDKLYGGFGSDTYVFEIGSGNDIIFDDESKASRFGVDKIKLGRGITQDNITLERNGDNLQIGIKGEDDSIEIKGQFSYISKIEEIEFSNGLIWDYKTIENMNLVDLGVNQKIVGSDTADVLSGGTGQDLISGKDGDDLLEGNSDDDELWGGNGNDIFIGGQGDDLLTNIYGTDTFKFAKGFGNDTIQPFKKYYGGNDTITKKGKIDFIDIESKDIRFTVRNEIRDVNDLYIEVLSTNDSIKIEDFFTANESYVDEIQFLDGVTWTMEEILKVPVYYNISSLSDDMYRSFDNLGNVADLMTYIISGTNNNDIIWSNMNSTVVGGKGNDEYYLSNTNNKIEFSKGDGQDYVHSYRDLYLEFKNIKSTEIEFTTNDFENMIIKVKGTNDQIALERLELDRSGLKSIQFSDTTWGVNEIATQSLHYYGDRLNNDMFKRIDTNYAVIYHGGSGHDDLTLESNHSSSKIYGEAGNDYLNGGQYADELIGGEGSDLLYGREEDDILDGGTGDDRLEGGEGNDFLVGRQGHDLLNGGYDDDVLVGGAGNDVLSGGVGSNIYKFENGHGKDQIELNRYSTDTIKFMDRAPSEIDFIVSGLDGKSVTIRSNNEDQITIENYLDSYTGKLSSIEFSDGTIWNEHEIDNKIRNQIKIGSNGDDTLQGYDNEGIIDVIYGNDGDDSLDGKKGDDKLYGGSGADRLIGGNGNDRLEGGSGNDTLEGGSNNDVLIGGQGDDLLNGEHGSDEYQFSRGFGKDTVYNYNSNSSYRDTLRFTDINSSDITWVFPLDCPQDLVLKVDGTDDQITIQYYLQNSNYRPDSIVFADGETWSKTKQADMFSKFTFEGTGDSETIFCPRDSKYDVRLNGYGGDDKLYATAGDDVLNGGTGDDYLEGNKGNDLYVFSGNFGKDIVHERTNWDGDKPDSRYEDTRSIDTIKLEDVLSNQIRWSVRQGIESDLVLNVNGTTNGIVLLNYLSDKYSRIEAIEFADGEYWNKEDIVKNVGILNQTGNDEDDELHGGVEVALRDKLNGRDGNDKLYGYEGDDVLVGGSGDDLLEGGLGSDEYIFSRGFGNDIVNEAYSYDGSIDKIKFTDLNSNQIEWIASQEHYPDWMSTHPRPVDLQAKVIGSSDVITFKDFLSSPSKRFEYVEFANGEKWTPEQVKERFTTLDLYGTEEDDILRGADAKDIQDKIYGYEGNDYILGNSGSDTIYGGFGDDTLHGEGGSDYLYGGSGNDKVYGDNEFIGNRGDDILEGGAGNDYLQGAYGNDLYVFEKGFGEDTISEHSFYNDEAEVNIDRIVFKDILSSDISWSISKENSNDVIIKVKDTEDSITLENYHSKLNERIECIEFADGEIWDRESIRSKFNNFVVNGSSGADKVIGGSGEDLIDQLYGFEGNDTLIGYAGNDMLDGGAGDDIYEFVSNAEGIDTITDSEGFDTINHISSLKNVMFEVQDTDMILSFTNSTDKITIKNNSVENFVFNNEHSISSQQVDLLIQAMNNYCTTNGVANWKEAIDSNNEDVIQLVTSYAQAYVG